MLVEVFEVCWWWWDMDVMMMEKLPLPLLLVLLMYAFNTVIIYPCTFLVMLEILTKKEKYVSTSYI